MMISICTHTTRYMLCIWFCMLCAIHVYFANVSNMCDKCSTGEKPILWFIMYFVCVLYMFDIWFILFTYFRYVCLHIISKWFVFVLHIFPNMCTRKHICVLHMLFVCFTRLVCILYMFSIKVLNVLTIKSNNKK